MHVFSRGIYHSRALRPLSSYINDLKPLTSCQFLVGGSLLSIPKSNAILNSPNLEIGQLVLLKVGSDKFQDWKLVRILKTYKGVMNLFLSSILGCPHAYYVEKGCHFMIMLDSRTAPGGMFQLIHKAPTHAPFELSWSDQKKSIVDM